jgi:hypothetical protein
MVVRDMDKSHAHDVPAWLAPIEFQEIGPYWRVQPGWYCASGKRNIREPDFDDLAATAME